MNDLILSIKHLNKYYGNTCEHCKHGLQLVKNRCPHCNTIYAVNDVSIDIFENEVIGIVGESGSGKSTLMQCLYFDQTISSGEGYLFHYDHGKTNIFELSRQKHKYIKNHYMGMVYQNPYIGLKMHFSSLANVSEKMLAASYRNVSEMVNISTTLLNTVKIDSHRHQDQPKYFSGGMQQRVQIAKALSNNPPLLLLDEVTTGLDLSVQANVLDLIRQIKRDSNISVMIVSHDLAVIRMLTDRTYVMLDGKIVESGLTDQILEDPQHPYTQQLVSSII